MDYEFGYCVHTVFASQKSKNILMIAVKERENESFNNTTYSRASLILLYISSMALLMEF